MTPYLFVFGVLSAFAIANHVKQFRQMRLYFFILSALMLILFAGLRQAGVGADDMSYINAFLDSDKYIDILKLEYRYEISNFNMEHGLVILMALVSVFTDDAVIFFLIVAAISVGLNVYVISRFGSFVFLGILIYFTNMYFQKDLNQIRIGLASAVVFLSFFVLYKKKIIFHFSLLFIAILIHFSTLVAVSGYFMNKLRFNVYQSSLILVASVIISFFGLSMFLVSFLPQSGALYQKLSFYIEWSQHNYKIGLTDPVNLKNLLLVIFFIYFYKFFDLRFGWFNFMFNTLLFMTSLRLILSDFAILSARLSSVFSFVDFLLIPLMLLVVKQKMFGSMLIIVYVMMVFYLTLSNPKWSGGLPYSLSIL